MNIVLFEIKLKGEIKLVEVRAYWNRGTQYETISFTNSYGSRALVPGIYDIAVLMWGAPGAGVNLKIKTGYDQYNFDAMIEEGTGDIHVRQIIVGNLEAFGVAMSGANP